MFVVVAAVADGDVATIADDVALAGFAADVDIAANKSCNVFAASGAAYRSWEHDRQLCASTAAVFSTSKQMVVNNFCQTECY